jgi:AraC-like DNA-binding protein
MKQNRPHKVDINTLGVYAFQSQHNVDFEMGFREDDYHKLCLVLRGFGQLEAGKQHWDLKERDLVFVPEGESHRFQDEKQRPMTLAMICFKESGFRKAPTAASVIAEFKDKFESFLPTRLWDKYQHVNVLNAYKIMIFEQTQQKKNYQAMLISELVRLLIFLSRSQSELEIQKEGGNEKQNIAGSLFYMENYFHSDVSVEKLATMSQMSYRKYTELFKTQMKKTVIQHLTDLRISYAKKRLLETGEVTYSAIDSGFNDTSHFHRVFKKTTGQTPGQFIKENS